MKKYLIALKYFINPHNKLVGEAYYEDLAHVIKYLHSLKIGEKVKTSSFLENVCSIIPVAKANDMIIYKIVTHKKWDLQKEFSSSDIAWIVVNKSYKLIMISFDKDFIINALPENNPQ